MSESSDLGRLFELISLNISYFRYVVYRRAHSMSGPRMSTRPRTHITETSTRRVRTATTTTATIRTSWLCAQVADLIVNDLLSPKGFIKKPFG